MADPVELPPGWSFGEATTQLPPGSLPPGWSIEPPSERSTGERAAGLAKAGGVGVAEGAIGLATAPGNAGDLMSQAGAWIVGKAGGDSTKYQAAYEQYREQMKSLGRFGVAPTAAEVKKEIEKHTGPFYKPQDKGEKFAHTVGQFAPGTLFPGTAAQRVGAQWLAPAVASETAGQLTEGTAAEPYARFGAAMFAPAAFSAATRLVTPLPASAEHAAAVGALEAAPNNVTSLTAGQRTGHRPLQNTEGAATQQAGGGQRLTDTIEEGKRQFAGATMGRVGSNARTNSPEAMLEARTALNAEFQEMERTALSPIYRLPGMATPHLFALGRRVDAAMTAAEQRLPPSTVPRDMAALRDDITNVAATGRAVPIGTYQGWRTRILEMQQGATHPAEVRFFHQASQALDDTVEAMMTPDAVDRYRVARDRWAHLSELRDAMKGSADDMVSPAKLLSADARRDPNASVEGRGLYTDLARSGARVLKPLPDSGTPGRLTGGAVLGGIGSIPGVMLGDSALLAGGAIGGARMGELAGPMLGARAVSNPWMQWYLGNQMLAPIQRGLSARQAALIAALQAAGETTGEDH